MSLLNNLVTMGSNFVISHTSNTSTNSVKNITSLTELPKGQYLNKPSTNYFKNKNHVSLIVYYNLRLLINVI